MELNQIVPDFFRKTKEGVGQRKLEINDIANCIRKPAQDFILY